MKQLEELVQQVRHTPTHGIDVQYNAARFMARNLTLSAAPKAWPRKPSRLAYCGSAQIDELFKQVSRGERPTNDQEYLAAQDWMLERTSVRYENYARLRGLLWCVSTLRYFEGDQEAMSLGKLAHDYLREVWGVDDDVPNDSSSRERIVARVVDRMSREALR